MLHVAPGTLNSLNVPFTLRGFLPLHLHTCSQAPGARLQGRTHLSLPSVSCLWGLLVGLGAEQVQVLAWSGTLSGDSGQPVATVMIFRAQLRRYSPACPRYVPVEDLLGIYKKLYGRAAITRKAIVDCSHLQFLEMYVRVTSDLPSPRFGGWGSEARIPGVRTLLIQGSPVMADMCCCCLFPVICFTFCGNRDSGSTLCRCRYGEMLAVSKVRLRPSPPQEAVRAPGAARFPHLLPFPSAVAVPHLLQEVPVFGGAIPGVFPWRTG